MAITSGVRQAGLAAVCGADESGRTAVRAILMGQVRLRLPSRRQIASLFLCVPLSTPLGMAKYVGLVLGTVSTVSSHVWAILMGDAWAGPLQPCPCRAILLPPVRMSVLTSPPPFASSRRDRALFAHGVAHSMAVCPAPDGPALRTSISVHSHRYAQGTRPPSAARTPKWEWA